jgi:hypothetical protein
LGRFIVGFTPLTAGIKLYGGPEKCRRYKGL